MYSYISVAIVVVVAWYVNRISNKQAENFLKGDIGLSTASSQSETTPTTTPIPGSGEFFDSIASTYDFLNEIISLGYQSKWRKTAITYITPFTKVLDVATGTGDVAFELYTTTTATSAEENKNDIEIIGIDPSENMLSLARKKKTLINAIKSDTNVRIDFVKGNAEDLPFSNSSFDSVIISFGIRNFHDRQKGLHEISRVLNTNGKLVILEISTPSVQNQNPILFYMSRFVVKYLLVPFSGLVSNNFKAYRYLLQSMDQFPDKSEFETLLIHAGFQLDHYQRLPPFGFGPELYAATKISSTDA